MNFTIELEQENDGRWLAEVIDLPSVLVYGQTKEEALAKVQASLCACLPISSNMVKLPRL